MLVVDGLYLVLTCEPLLVWFAFRFRSEDPPARSDAVVILLGGHADRTAKAAELHRRGLAPAILLARTARDPFDGTAYYQQTLVRDGVPTEAIEILPGPVVGSTHDEAVRVLDYVRTHPVRRITVVTTAYHTARARWTFRRVLRGIGVDVRMVASEDPLFAEGDWFVREGGIRQYLSEALKTAYYRLAY